MSIKKILNNKKEPKGKTITIRLTAENTEMIEKLHKISGWARNTIINDLIESHKSEFDTAERLRGNK